MQSLRDIILSIMPDRWREAAIAESRLWQTTCRSCGTVSNTYDLGALRWKARGNKVLRTRCPACGKSTGHDQRWVGKGS